MDLRVNGDERDVHEGLTVAELVDELVGSRKGCAVAVEGLMVARGEWEARRLRDGEAVEVLVAAQGG